MLRHRPTGLTLQVGLILLPLLVLLLVGIYFLRQDKLLAQTEARERANDLGRQIIAQFKSAETNFLSPDSYTNLNIWPENEAFFQLGPGGELIFPHPLQTNRSPPSIIAGLTPTLSNLWAQAEQSEFLHKKPAEALNAWQLLSQTNLPSRAAAVASFNLAILLRDSQKQSEPADIFNRLKTLPLDQRFESGLPIAHAAALKSLEFASNNTNPLLDIGWKFISEPTEFSSFLLDQLQTDADTKARLKALWNQQQRARLLSATTTANSNRPSADLHLVQTKSFLAEINGTNWWLFKFGTNVFARSQIGMRNQCIESISALNLPPYFSAAISSGGHLLYSTGRTPPEQFIASVTAAGNGPSELERVDLYLANPDLLYARQHQRALWLGALLALSTLVAAAGLTHATRSHLKQQRLNELKSNFVSSVSHELRAPLASMRLMSEGLQSGRIHDQEKQQEYFNYLVQECRRLSVLVENILDFSRIDQNRKTYDFEPLDLRDVIQAALKTISPVAAERQVKLEFAAVPSSGDYTTNADPLALQQAVVNLLDNAIKHSPPEETVSISLQEDPLHFHIHVRDHGPGVPPHEREQIFQRFYRLGSELRRETPGVGIGLSIVKHIVEAHHGTVYVEAAPEPGALFIISLPKK